MGCAWSKRLSTNGFKRMMSESRLREIKCKTLWMVYSLVENHWHGESAGVADEMIYFWGPQTIFDPYSQKTVPHRASMCRPRGYQPSGYLAWCVKNMRRRRGEGEKSVIFRKICGLSDWKISFFNKAFFCRVEIDIWIRKHEERILNEFSEGVFRTQGLSCGIFNLNILQGYSKYWV